MPNPAYPAPPHSRWRHLTLARIIEIATLGGLAIYERRGQSYMQALGRKGGQAGRGESKRRDNRGPNVVH